MPIYKNHPAVATLHGSTSAETEALVLEEHRTQNPKIVHGNRRSEPLRAIIPAGAGQPIAPAREWERSRSCSTNLGSGGLSG